MAEQTEFGRELETLLKRFVDKGAEPADIAKEAQEQLNVFVGRHNLQFESNSEQSSAIGPGA